MSIAEPLDTVDRAEQVYAETAFWTDDSAAVAMVELATGLMVGTMQAYRSSPTIHGLEIGYLIHDQADRRKGFASQGLGLFSDLLFSTRKTFWRQQLIIEVWNTASWKVAERCGFVREGILRSCGFGEGDPADAFVYSRTRKDMLQQHASSNGAHA